MTQSIIIQIGQCGNQIGYRFWDCAVKEYDSVNKLSNWNPSLSSFFYNSEKKINHFKTATCFKSLKARAVLIDMEEGVINDIMKSPLATLFEQKQVINDVSGAGNNWAVGYFDYGNKYKDQISEVIRKSAEQCDCLQCFFCLHSMGGGTGSGVGTFVLRLLEEEYPEVFRFVTAVYPSEDDDVVTSPYNSLLAMHQLTEAADFVIPIENQALINITQNVSKHSSSKVEVQKSKSEKPFDSMNNIVASLLLNLTSSSRFEGSMNVDLNEISMNLVPFPKLHYITTSMTPIFSSSLNFVPKRNFDQIFTDAFSKENQLLCVDPKSCLYLACALMVRGEVEVSDIRKNIDKIKPKLNFIYWNQEGWKTGLCSVPPANMKSSLLTLANNTCIHYTCMDLRNRFVKLYKRKAHLHHYTHVSGFEQSLFDESLTSIDLLISEYEKLEATSKIPPPCFERLKVF
ncbi:tubulin epsilon chain isoform X1 [Hydra vulgaris]|uniref:tubulin epsilon chain isoform X1 n=1 Tax=Hydra vulgaris TaxID=6087 RepID=UPI000641084C|nr:tubulin epsilon chain [Hydra vulgaris]